MALPTLPQSLPQLVIDALLSAGATEEMVAAAVAASGECDITHPIRGGRPSKYADRAARDRAYRAQKKPRVERRVETPPRDEMRVETLRGRLEEAGQGHFDPAADIAPIRALLDQGCDLEADVVPDRDAHRARATAPWAANTRVPSAPRPVRDTPARPAWGRAAPCSIR
jgi:hypothetical protein